MSGQPPTRDSDRSPLGFDELVALFVAFSAIGAILWWTLGQRASTWIGQSGLLGTRVEPSGQVGTVGLPGITASPSPASAGAPSPTAAASTATDTTTVTTEATTGTAAPAAPTITAPAAPTAPAAVVPRPAVPVPIPAPIVVAPPAPSPVPASPAPTIVVPNAGANAVTFPDVPTTYWAYPFINELGKRGMIAGVGDGSFQPDQPVNRAQYAALLSEVLSGARQGEIPFSDVQPGFWAAQPIDAAVKAGFLKGYPDKTFEPAEPITKMQVLLSLANGFQLPKPADPNAAIQPLADRDQIPEWAKPAVGAATQAGVVVNYPDVSQFRPNESATRAEVAAMLYQALKTTGQLPPIQSNYIVQP
ncbi:MAG: S-layer homology domain-containing protein [Elainella sp.]